MSSPIDPSEISLILPGQSAPDGLAVDGLPPVVWLRNPKTGVIHKFLRPQQDDTIARCLGERYTSSSEAAARAQAIELAKLQGRPLPAWAFEVEEVAEPATVGIGPTAAASDLQAHEHEQIAQVRARNASARKAFGIEPEK